MTALPQPAPVPPDFNGWHVVTDGTVQRGDWIIHLATIKGNVLTMCEAAALVGSNVKELWPGRVYRRDGEGGA